MKLSSLQTQSGGSEERTCPTIASSKQLSGLRGWVAPHQSLILTCLYGRLLVSKAAEPVSSMALMGDGHTRMLQQAA